MKRFLLFVMILCITAPFSSAQLWKWKRWETSLGVGPSFFFDDIGGYSRSKNLLGFRDLSYRQTMFDINGNIKYRLTRTLNARMSATFGMLHGIDTWGSNEGRAMEATTIILEPALLGEYYFVKNRSESSYLFLRGRGFWKLLSSLDFYAFSGFGGVYYDVHGNPPLVELGMKESGFAALIPVGLGASLIYTPNINFGLELGGRYTFTDYIDGYTSQYSTANDVYYFLNFTITYKVKTGPRGLPSFR